MTRLASGPGGADEPAPMTGLPPVLTVEQAADLLQVSAPVLRRLSRDGEIPGRRVGGQWRYSRDLLHQHINGLA